MPRHIEADKGDKVLIDIGGYGLLVKIDERGRLYDIEHVRVTYNNMGGVRRSRPMQVNAVVRNDAEEFLFKKADSLRIWKPDQDE